MKNKLLSFSFLFIAIAVVLSFATYICLNMPNDNGRIDIYNTGKKENTISIISSSPSIKVAEEFNNREWLTEKGIGYAFVFPTNTKYNEGEIVFKATGSGALKIEFMGKFQPLDNSNTKLKKVYNEYKDVTINDEIVFSEPKKLWHNGRITYICPSVNNETYTLKFKYRKPFPFGNKNKESITINK